MCCGTALGPPWPSRTPWRSQFGPRKPKIQFRRTYKERGCFTAAITAVLKDPEFPGPCGEGEDT